MAAISAVIITRNEARHIVKCLDSLEDVVDEVVVVDSGSTDETIALCTARGARVYSKDWTGYAAAKNYGNDQAQGPYILSIDADESLSPELRTLLFVHKSQLTDVYGFARRNLYRGRWLRGGGWYPDVKVRLFPKGGCRWVGDYVHEKLQIDPGLSTRILPGDLLHDTIDSISDHIARINHYSDLRAQEWYKLGKRPSWARQLLRPAWRFLRMYLLQGGVREGWEGFWLCRISAMGSFLEHAKLREHYRRQGGA
ncbi:MAG: glycosyltransferase family 2 protein [Bacteroidia bacterium]